jgi:hypothetical protein
MTEKAPTHIAYALRVEPGSKKYGRWLEIGTARIEGVDKPAHISLDRTLIGGWNGYCYLAPVGVKPPDLKDEPRRPSDAVGDPG